MLISLGASVEGRDLRAYVRPGPAGCVTVVFGGFHGDEPKSVRLAQSLMASLQSDPSVGLHTGWVVVPIVNPDGFERRRRRNARGVDLNRNFPTQNWKRVSPKSRMYGGAEPGSEPETRAVMAVVETYRPDRIITLHSISGGRECNNFDGPAEELARAMSDHNGYRVTGSIGYPTPGSFGTWSGVERGIPTVTLELPAAHSTARCWADNRRALLEVLDTCAAMRR